MKPDTDEAGGLLSVMLRTSAQGRPRSPPAVAANTGGSFLKPQSY